MDLYFKNPVQHPLFEAAIAQFEDQISRDVEKESIGGITAAVVMGNDGLWAKGFGWADTRRQIPANVQTIYRVGSITKCFTAVLLVQFHEQGILGLDDKVEQYLPEIKQLGGYGKHKPITFRQLACHTSGLVREPKLSDAASGPIEEWETKILASIPTTSFQFAPGECFNYSNIGYGILGLAISRAAKQSFVDLVGDFIFGPLKMKNSSFVLTPEMWPRLAVGYAKQKDGSSDTELPDKEHVGRGYKVPNGGIYSSVGDLGRFIAAQTGAAPVHILSAENRSEMQRIQTPGSEYSGNGLGFNIQIEEGGVRMVGHAGRVAGYLADHLFNPESGIGVVLLRNYDAIEVKEIENLRRGSKTLLRKLVAANTKDPHG